MDIKQEIQKTLEMLQSMEIAKSHMDKLNANIYKHSQRLSFIEKELRIKNNELYDYSLNKLFTKILGNQKEQEELLRQSYLKLVLEHRELEKTLTLLHFEAEVLTEKLKDYPGIKDKLNALLLTRANLLDENEEQLKTAISTIDQGIFHHIKIKTEAKEAVMLAYEIKVKLLDIHECLTAVTEWKLPKIKQTKEEKYIDKAQELIYRVKQLLFQLEGELEDINKMQNTYQFPEALTDSFTEIYYENLILDWILNGSIIHAKHCIKNKLDKIELLIRSLKVFQTGIDKSIKSLEHQKKEQLKKGV